MKVFLDFINGISPLSSNAINEIKNVTRVNFYPKNYLLIQEMAQAQHLYFIEDGLARMYYYKNGKDVTEWFGFENTLIGPVIRNFERNIGLYQVKLLEPSTIISISFDNLQKLFDRFHDVERLGRVLAIQAVMHLQERIDALQFETAEQKYAKLIKLHPSILHRVSLGHIASYLGITAVTLSRIRAKQ